MKDYYYFLGISADASIEDIKKAYRKLSMKYHPDKNDNDLFFEDRFREVQEAYDTLIDENRRTMYDRMRGHQLQAKNSSLPPSIEFFSVTKIRAMKGEEISVTWKTHHADVVKIQPFGLVPPYGEKNIKITEFKNQKFHLVLQANNSFINKTVVKGITIQEIFQVNLEKQNPEPINKAKMDRVEKDTFSKAIRFIIAFLIILLIAVFFITKIA